MIQVLVGSEIFGDGSLPPLHVGDVINVMLGLVTFAAPTTPGTATYRVRVQPDFGRAPGPDREDTLTWPFEVSGNGWTASCHLHTPVTGQTSLTGYLTPDFARPVQGRPGVVTGRVRRLQLLEQHSEVTQNRHRFIPGTERLRDLGTSPDRYWPRWFPVRRDGPFEERGILVDLDLDDIPEHPPRFDACAVAVNGTDVWAMDRSAPVLMHLDTSHTPATVTEYVLPLPFDPPDEGMRRQIHADDDGCWITCPAEIVRCDRSGPQEVTARRVARDGGGFTVHVDGRLFAITQPYPSLRHDPRYGRFRFDPAEHPFHELVDGELVPVDDEETIALAWDREHRGRTDRAVAADGTTWIGNGDLLARSPDGTERTIDLERRSRGRVNWVSPDIVGDPDNADIIDPIMAPPVASGAAAEEEAPDWE